MRAREALLTSDLIPGDLERLFPICTPTASDSASFDEVLELLYLGGRPLPHAVLMMIPEAWENNTEMDPARRAVLRVPLHADRTVGRTCQCVLHRRPLDRGGTGPQRSASGTVLGDLDGLVVLASEAGVLDLDPATVVRKGTPAARQDVPGRHGRRSHHRGRRDQGRVGRGTPYEEWLHAGMIHLEELPEREHVIHTRPSIARRQQSFGYTEEELRVILTRWRRPVWNPSAPWAPTRRWPCCPTGRDCCSTASRSCSPR